MRPSPLSLEAWPALLCLVAALGCGSSETFELTHDLVGSYSEATARVEAREYSIGTSGSEPELLTGWSFSERDQGRKRHFRWGLRPGSEFAFTVVSPRDFVLRLEGLPAPAARAPRSFSVSVNNTPVGTVQTRAGLAEYAMPIPESVQVRGLNRVALSYDAGEPTNPVSSSEKRPNLAIAWYRFVLEGLEQPAGGPRVESPNAIFLPFGSSVEYLLTPREETGLRFERWRVLGDRVGSLEIHVQSDGSRVERVGSLGAGSREVLNVPLPVAAGRPIRLTLTAVAEQAAATPGPTSREDESEGIVIANPAIFARPVPAPDALEAPPDAQQPNIIVYLVDTLRADRLACYGHSVETSPNIDRFAAGATLFENARAQSSWTLAAVTSIFTGVWPPAHGVVYPNTALTPEAITLAEILHGAGYATSAIVANRFVTEKYGLEQGFQEHQALELSDSRSDVVLAKTIAWLESRDRSRPFFLYLHTVDPHQPYLPKEEFRQRFAPHASEMFDAIRAAPGRLHWEPTQSVVKQLLELYDALIAQNDAAFGETLAYLEREDLFDDSLIVFLSDHGEEFFEHRSWTHGANLYAETLNVPLIIKLPGQTSGNRAQRIAQHIDLLPTLVDYLGLGVSNLPGRSLLPDILGEPSEEVAPAVFSHTFRNKRDVRSVIESGWKYMERRAPEGDEEVLVQWQQDPREMRNLTADHPIRSQYSSLLIERELSRGNPMDAVDAVLDEVTRNELRALGYLD